MKRDIDFILKHALAPKDRPDPKLDETILRKAEEMTGMDSKKKRFRTAVFAAAAVLTLGSVTGFAAWKYLSPAQISEENADKRLAEAFSGADAVLINETQVYGGYRATLLGLVSGEAISEYLEAGGELDGGKTYIAVAIEHADGSPMTDTGSDDWGKQEDFLVSPYVKGIDPLKYNIFFMHGGYFAFVKDGIEYRLIETENVEVFADRGLYLGVSDGTFYRKGLYLFDESTGEIKRDDSYEGLNALFELPIDASKANPEEADRRLRELKLIPD